MREENCCDFSRVLGKVPEVLKISSSHSLTTSGPISDFWQYYSNNYFRLRKTGSEIVVFLKWWCRCDAEIKSEIKAPGSLGLISCSNSLTACGRLSNLSVHLSTFYASQHTSWFIAILSPTNICCCYCWKLITLFLFRTTCENLFFTSQIHNLWFCVSRWCTSMTVTKLLTGLMQ